MAWIPRNAGIMKGPAVAGPFFWVDVTVGARSRLNVQGTESDGSLQPLRAALYVYEPVALGSIVHLGDDLPAAANKDEERFEGLRGDGDGLIFAQQDLAVGVDLKGAEFVENFESCSHASSYVEPFLAGCWAAARVLNRNLPGWIFDSAAIVPLIGEN